MTIGLLLLSTEGHYLTETGYLPIRPAWDKQFLLDVCKDRRLLCSRATMSNIPSSIISVAKSITTDTDSDYDINLGIDSFSSLPDLLLITRSINKMLKGKKFRLDNYKLILKQGEIEIWTKI